MNFNQNSHWPHLELAMANALGSADPKSHNHRRCAPVSALTTIKDVTPTDARAIRELWRSGLNSSRYCREKIDAILGTSGVEYLGWHKRTGRDVYYANAGDTYATTVIFHGSSLQVGCWGNLIERGLIHEDWQL